MKRQLLRIYNLLGTFGIDPLKTIRSIRGMPQYLLDLRQMTRLARNETVMGQTEFPFGKLYPCLEDRFKESGTAKGHYFHQDLLVARRIFINHPARHVDVGSSIEGFVAHVASFRPIEVFDIRPLSGSVPNMMFTQLDFMANIGERMHDYTDSLSCLHALEHFGLARYGDPLNFYGHLVGLNNCHKILKNGGKFYFSVPIGPQRIEFNGHRVFSVKYLIDCFANKYVMDQFSFVDDKGDLHENVTLTDCDIRTNCGCVYGCGIFEMTKG